MSILPTQVAPFGFLQPLHERVLKAGPITTTNWPIVVSALAPIGLQCLLVQYEETRPYRMAVAVLGIAFMIQIFLTYRFQEAHLNGFNLAIAIGMMHLSGKYVLCALVEGPIVDPYVARGRSPVLAAIDMAINSRWVGLGQVNLSKGGQKKERHGTVNGTANGHTSNHVTGVDGGVKLQDKSIPEGKERYLPYTNVRRSRLQALLRHLGLFATHYIVCDGLKGLIEGFAPDTIANPNGVHNSVGQFIEIHDCYLFPYFGSPMLSELSHGMLGPSGILHPVKASRLVVETVIEAFVGVTIWQEMCMLYRIVAIFAVGTGLYEVEAWEVDLYDAPWKADSILDMWGKRWHQLFRQHFIFFGTIILRTVRLPVNSVTLMPLVFFFSGMLHAIGQISASPTPFPPWTASFFFYSGVGSACEAIFRRVTGKRVRGIWGRIWMWTFFFATARQACWAWCDSGIGGLPFVPPIPGVGDRSVGPLAVNLFRALMADVVPKS